VGTPREKPWPWALPCRNGLIDRAEFGRLAESTGAGTEYALFHWLADATIDELFDKYADSQAEALTFESFKLLVCTPGLRCAPMTGLQATVLATTHCLH
jgi:hypothetical protein